MDFNIFFCSCFFAIIVIATSDKCIQNSPCSCEYEDEKVISLRPLSLADTFYNFTIGNLTYFFHPCTDKTLPINTSNDCTKSPTSLCIYNATSKEYENIGNTTEAKIESSSMEGLYDIVYRHNASVTHITLICTVNFQSTVLYANSNFTPSKHNLMLFSATACEHYEHKALSTGSVLVILFMLFVTVYFLGGALVLHFLRGARGQEVIPNIDFWRDLPLLVKDGVVFLQNGCKVNVSTSDSYDRI